MPLLIIIKRKRRKEKLCKRKHMNAVNTREMMNMQRPFCETFVETQTEVENGPLDDLLIRVN